MKTIHTDPSALQNQSNEVMDIFHRIQTLRDRIDALAKLNPLPSSLTGTVRSRLSGVVGNTDKAANSVRLMASALSSIAMMYEQTERSLSNPGSMDRAAFRALLNDIRSELKDIGGVLGLDPAAIYSMDPVNLSNGNYVYEKTFFHYDTPLSMNFRIFYNACETAPGSLGRGWMHNFERRIVIDDRMIRILNEDGSSQAFVLNASGGYDSVVSSSTTLVSESYGYRYEDAEQDIYCFDHLGTLLSVETKDGWRKDYLYHEGSLIRVESSDGISLRLIYHPSGNLMRVTDQTGRELKFLYEEDLLVGVVDPAGNTIRYSYDVQKRLNRILAQNGELSVENLYDAQGRTVEQVFADSGRILYRYDPEQQCVALRRQNGSEVLYYHDELFRNTKTVYPDGEECFVYNADNLRESYTDKLGRTSRYRYDELGRLMQFINAKGNVLELSYNAAGQLAAILLDGESLGQASYDASGRQSVYSDANGNQCFFEYDESGRITAVTHEDGSRTALFYDAQGNIVRVVDPVTGATEYQYDDCRRAICSIDALGNRTHYQYDVLDQLVSVTNAQGHTRSYQYDLRGNLIRIVDFNGGVTSIVYNAMNKPVRLTDPDGNTTLFEYDTSLNLVKKIAADGGVTSFEYDAESRLTAIVHPDGGKESAQYDAVGNLIRRSAQDGATFAIAYDELNRPVSVQDPSGKSRSAEYNSIGKVTAIRYEDGSEERFSYDRMGNRLSHTDQAGYTRYFKYNALNQVTEISDHRGVLSTFTYGSGGKLLREESCSGAFLEYGYDEAGNLVSVSDSIRGQWRFKYDELQQIVQVEHVGEGTESYEYDAQGNINAMIDGEGHRTAYQHTPAGALEKVTDPCGTETVYRYDPCYRLLQIIQPESGHLDVGELNALNKAQQALRLTTYKRDPAGNVIEVVHNNDSKIQYRYDLCGRISSKLDEDGNLTTYTYRPDGAAETITFQDGKSVKYQYDALKRITQIEDWLGVTRFQRDAAGRLTEVAAFDGNRVSYAWDESGLCTTMRYPDGSEFTFDYDAGRRLAACKGRDAELRYAYDGNGRIRERSYSNGLRAQYHFDAPGRIAAMDWRRGPDELASFSYEYDRCARKTRIAERLPGEQLRDWSYRYDPRGFLSQVFLNGQCVHAFEYDAFGNRTAMKRSGERVTYEYDSLDRLIRSRSRAGEETFRYDARGNLSLQTGCGKTLRLRHDALNRLAWAASDTGEAEYSYNGLGMLSGIRSRIGGVQREQSFLYDYAEDENRLLGVCVDGSWESYVWDSQPVFMMSQGAPSLLLNDERRSLRLVLGNHGESLHSYCDFGGSVQREASAPFGFTGYRYDPVTGFYDAGWRQYDPATGRFISPDPISGSMTLPTTLNPFIYCLSDPINCVDPTGMIFAWLAGGIVGAVANVGVKFAGDIINSVKAGKWTGSSWESYVGSAAGGFVQGSVFVVAGPTAAGAAGAATETFVTNGLSMIAGEEGYRKEDGYGIGQLAKDTGVSAVKGGVTGFAFGQAAKILKIPGVTSGKGSYMSVWKHVMTKAQRGIIANVTTKTMMKGLVAYGLVQAADKVLSDGIDLIKSEAKKWVTGTALDRLKDWIGGSGTALPTSLHTLISGGQKASCATL